MGVGSALWTEFIVNFLIVASVCFVMYEQLGQPSVEMLGYLARGGTLAVGDLLG